MKEDIGEEFNVVTHGIRKLLVLNSKFTIEASMQFMEENGIDTVFIASQFLGENIDFLLKYPFIHGVSIGAGTFDYRAIHSLKQLRYLSITRNDNQPINFSNWPFLERCSLFWRAKSESLFTCSTLKELALWYYKKRDLAELTVLDKLTKLEITQSPIHSLRGIENLIALENLSLNYLRELTSLTGVENLKLLKDLHLENCSKINSFQPLSCLQELRLLYLSRSGPKPIQTLSPLRGLEKLEDVFLSGVEVLDGDMTPLIGKKNAIFSSFQYYSHTVQEMDKINGTVRPKQPWEIVAKK